MRRSLAEPKNLRAIAPSMPDSCLLVRRFSHDAWRPIAYQLIVTRRSACPDPEAFVNEREFSNPGFKGQKRKQNHAIAIEPLRTDMTRSKACQRRQAVSEFMILTGFSRCQGGMIGRVSRRPKPARSPALKIRIFHDDVVIHREIGPPFRPRLHRRRRLSCGCAARGAAGS